MSVEWQGILQVNQELRRKISKLLSITNSIPAYALGDARISFYNAYPKRGQTTADEVKLGSFVEAFVSKYQNYVNKLISS